MESERTKSMGGYGYVTPLHGTPPPPRPSSVEVQVWRERILARSRLFELISRAFRSTYRRLRLTSFEVRCRTGRIHIPRTQVIELSHTVRSTHRPCRASAFSVRCQILPRRTWFFDLIAGGVCGGRYPLGRILGLPPARGDNIPGQTRGICPLKVGKYWFVRERHIERCGTRSLGIWREVGKK
jgi:hypothetical protein